MNTTPKITDVPLADLRRMLADTERMAGPNTDAAKILRRVIRRREALADEAATRGGQTND